MCLPFLAPLGAAMMGTGGTIAAGTAVGASTAAIAAGTAASTAAAMAGTTAVLSLGSTALSAVGSIQQAKYQSDVAKNNAIAMKYQQEDALERGQIAEDAQRRKNAARQSQAIAEMAGNGLNLDSSTPIGIIEDMAQYGEMDAQAIRTNAQRSSQSLGYQAEMQDSQADLYTRAGYMNAAGSVLSGAGSVGRDWYMYRGGLSSTSQGNEIK